MTQVLQRFVQEFGPIVTNAFDLDVWREATTLHSVRLRVRVREGGVRISLRNVCPNGETEIERVSIFGSGSAHSRIIPLDSFRGSLNPVVEEIAPGSDFDIEFLTCDAPHATPRRVNFVVCTFKRAPYVQNVARTFEDFAEKSPLGKHAHLTIVDNAGDCGVGTNRTVTVFQNANTGGAGGFGRGMFETVYGSLSGNDFSHLCLMDDDIIVHQEMFERQVAFLQYLRDGFHMAAPMYPASEACQVPTQSICFGHRFRSTVAPSDQSLMRNLPTRNIRAFAAGDRKADTTGWWWNCIPTSAIRKIGMPYPFFVKMDDVEYSLRLQAENVKLVIPLSFWVLHEDFEEKYSVGTQYFRYRNRLILLSLLGRLPSFRPFVKEYFTLVRAFIRKRQYEHATIMLMALRDFLDGPDACVGTEKEVLARIGAVAKVEKNAPIAAPPEDSAIVNQIPAIRWQVLRALNMLTLNYHFSPSRKKVTIDTSRTNFQTNVRHAKTITYWNGNKKVGYTVKRDSLRAARLTGLTWLRTLECRRLGKAAKAFAESREAFTGRDFWYGYGRLDRSFPAPLAEAGSLAGAVPGRAAPAQGESGKSGVTDRDQAFLNAIRNQHLGKRCFVLGNGPSLKVQDLDRLAKEFTFASNKIFLAFAETAWRPTYYSVEDPLVAENNCDRITELSGMTKIFPSHMLKFIPRRANHFFVEWLPPIDNRSPYREFSEDLSKGVCWGSTVTYSLLQMAVHMGFKEIYLLGVDHNYVESDKSDGKALIANGEINHFHPDYRKPGEKWNYPVLDRLEHSYEYARSHCDRIGVKVYNASRQTKLTAFERRDLDDVLAIPSST